MSAVLKNTGRILYALPFMVFGVNHLFMSSAMAPVVPAWIPGSTFWVIFTGIAMIAASISLLSGKLVREAGIGLAVMLIIFVLTIQLPGLFNPERMRMALIGLLKDTGLAGAALFISGIYAKRLTVTSRE